VIQINAAHVIMLAEQGVIDLKYAVALLNELEKIPKDLEMKDYLEDVHMNVENFVTSKIGKDAGGMMNLAKSRNDQVATALRMTLREQLIFLGESMISLENSLLAQSAKHAATIIPGYTHLQRAQPVTLGHHLLAYFDSLDRDFARLVDCYLRTDLSPMGSGALASTGFPINRERTAELLGFESILENSLDGVSSRDFATEAIYLCAQTMVDLSRLAEEIILWTTKEFSYAEISDAFSSTSSMMPQKKNAVVPEIFRAKTSQVLGDLVGAMGLLKALPLSYNLDLQELTRNLWSATDKTISSVSIFSELMSEIQFNTKNMLESATSDEFLFATELADYLVQKFKVPFREAHSRVGKLVRFATEKGNAGAQFTSIKPEVISEILRVRLSSEDLSSITNPAKVLAKRKAMGAPNPKMVSEAADARLKIVAKHVGTLASFKRGIEKGQNLLVSAERKIQGSVRDEEGKRKLLTEVKE
jgi:argininosuccinate lyase